jgi:hypothetical protein
MAGIVEREAVCTDRSAPTSDIIIGFNQQRIVAKMVGRAQSSRTSANNSNRCMLAFTTGNVRFNKLIC